MEKREFLRSSDGVSMPTYGLLAALVAVSSILAVYSVGERVDCVYGSIATSVDGGSGACIGSDPVAPPEGNHPPTITSTSLSDGQQMQAYSFTLAATDPDADDTLTWSWAGGSGDPLPAGLDLDPETGEITGTSPGGGTSTVQITVTDSAGATDVKSLSLHIVQMKLLADDGETNDGFGTVTVDGGRAAVGSGNSGQVYVFDIDSGDQLVKMTSDDWEIGDRIGGTGLAISGNYVLAGADGDDDNGTDAGAAYVFNATTGEQLRKLKPSSGAANQWFGSSVAISGGYGVIGAYGDSTASLFEGAAYVFDLSTGQEIRKLTASGTPDGKSFGGAVAADGGYAVIGADRARVGGVMTGAAYVFDIATGLEVVQLVANDRAASDNFGMSVALSGNYAVVGADGDDDNGSGSGSAYVFDITTGAQIWKLTASDGAASDYFGSSVAVSGGYAVVGAFGTDDVGTYSGAAYVFDLATGTQISKLTLDDAADGDRFGQFVAINGSRVLVGSRGDDDRASSAGSAAVFDLATGQQVTW